MAETFPRFPWLPHELRHMIWEFAIRPAVPGAHIFTISDNASRLCDDSQEYEDHVSVCQPRHAQPHSARIGGELHSANNNPSTYLTDSGLWTACRESRSVMERKLLKPKDSRLIFWNDRINELSPFCPLASTRRQIALCPSQDLIILQADTLTPFLWASQGVLDRTISTYRSAMLSSCTFWTAMLSRAGEERHIAIEYNPEWDSMSLHWGEIHGFVDLLLGPSLDESVAAPTHVWFIDYRLKRRNRVPTEKQLHAETQQQEPRVYYGNGLRYVEVSDKDEGDCGDGEWNDAFEKDRLHSLNNKPMLSRNGVRGCVRRAKTLLYKDEEYVDRLNIGILACEPC
ncbi:hypothetical protein QBC41DRAFT_157124 [Cercophora samala]|uniref:2EXR domain-containing protein n=1 Tax=Cercophora samala TaxID=330535 RepID=A0AA39Z898_9PEZI|nr:hypothetical protein QBC41DRAFT_157124 [Cercophora samala]